MDAETVVPSRINRGQCIEDAVAYGARRSYALRVEDAKAAARTTIAQVAECSPFGGVRQHVRVMKIALPGDDV